MPASSAQETPTEPTPDLEAQTVTWSALRRSRALGQRRHVDERRVAEPDGGTLATEGPATGATKLSEWLQEHAAEVGRVYASELARHYR
jgi:hypothetical protein